MQGKHDLSPPPAAGTQQHPRTTTFTYTNATYRMSLKISSMDKTYKNWLPWQRPLRDRKTNFRLIIHIRSSTNPENLAKIGPVH